MPRLSHADISMRHFPDLSDASFQIPAAQEDLLTRGLELTYDAFDDSELGGLDADPFTTPMPESRRHAPLTLSEITPLREKIDHEAVGDLAGTEILSPSRQAAENAKQTQSSVRPLLPKKESVDDMFARRKRDSYQKMGIDLTSRSTARLRRVPDDSTKEAPARAKTKAKPLEAVKIPPRSNATRAHAMDGSKAKTSRSLLGKDAGIVKHKPNVPSSSSTQPKPKSILKSSKPTSTLPTSTLSRTLTALSQTPKAERPKWGDVVAEVQHTSRGAESRGSGIGIMGGGLIDVLVMYGEKLKGTLGFSSSGNTPTISSNIDYTQPANNASGDIPNLMEDPPHNIAGSSSKPLTLSDITPSKSYNRRRNDPLRLSDLSPSRQPPIPSKIDVDSGGEEQPRPEVSPMRPSKKRASLRSPASERKKNKVYSKPPSERPESSKAALERGPPAIKPISKPRTLGPSNAANRAHSNAESLRPRVQSSSTISTVASKKPRLIAQVSGHDLKGKRPEASHAKIHNRRVADKEQHAPVPPGPSFASDVYRQRALEKAQTEREAKEKQKQTKSFKAGVIPYFNKPAPPARPAVRTTVPAAFTFQSDARAVQRNAEFEEKRKTWESRATHRALPMPNFAAMHAAQAQVVEAARGKRAVSVLRTEAPALTTMVRAKEREKYDEERRGREKAAEKLREVRERERSEEEEREYRQARKRTVPKAHEVPEWYKDVPKRKEVE